MKKLSNEDMQTETKKFHPFILMALFCAIMYTVIQLILTPIYAVILSDITLKMTIMPTIVEIVLSLCETLAFSLCYSLVIYTCIVKSMKTAIGTCGIYIAASIVRRIGALGVSLIMYKSVDKIDIFNVLIPITIETVQIGLVLLFSCLFGRAYRKKQKADRNTDSFDCTKDMGFIKVYSSSNPLMKGALAGGVMLSLVNIAMRVYSDISYGAPQGVAEILVMIVYYLSDILICALFYAMSWIILSKITAKYKISE